MSKAAELANLIGNINAGGGSGGRNLVQNGSFVVAQRGTSFSNTTVSQFCLDRFSVDVSGGGAFNVTQDTSVPEGFEKSLKLEVGTADSSIASSDAYRVTHAIEGQNFSQSDWGSSTAKACVLSFYVKSSVTGTYGVGFANSAETENYVAEYTISSANTWEKKTITVPLRTSGTWLTTTGVGVGIRWDLGSGTAYNGTAGQWQTTSSKVYRTSSCVNLIATGSATWQLAGVQFELGQNPTSFEHRTYVQDLLDCQRYLFCIDATDDNEGSGERAFGLGTYYNDTSVIIYIDTPVEMRATPSLEVDLNGSSQWLQSYVGATGSNTNAGLNVGQNGNNTAHRLYFTSSHSSRTAGQSSWNQVLDGARFLMKAEL